MPMTNSLFLVLIQKLKWKVLRATMMYCKFCFIVCKQVRCSAFFCFQIFFCLYCSSRKFAPKAKLNMFSYLQKNIQKCDLGKFLQQILVLNALHMIFIHFCHKCSQTLFSMCLHLQEARKNKPNHVK